MEIKYIMQQMIKENYSIKKRSNYWKYYKASDLSENTNTALKDNDVYQSMKTNEADPGGEAVNTNNTFGERFIKNAVASGLGSSIHGTGRKIGGKLWQGSGKVLKHLPFMGTAGRLVEQSGKILEMPIYLKKDSMPLRMLYPVKSKTLNLLKNG